MITLYIFSLCIGLICLLVLTFYIKDSTDSVLKALRLTINVLTISFVVNIITLITNSPLYVIFFQGAYYASIDFLLICFVRFIIVYTGIEFKYKNALYKTAVFVAIVDSISMILNSYYNHVFTVKRIILSDGDGVFVYNTNTFMYDFHLLFTFGLACIIFIVLIDKTLHTPSFYHKKYSIIIMLLAVALILNVGNMFLVIPVDITLPLYAIMAFLLYFFTVKYIPRLLLNSMLLYMMASMKIGIIVYDNLGQCIYVNNEIKSIVGDEENSDEIDLYFATQYISRGLVAASHDEWDHVVETEDGSLYYNIAYSRLLDKGGKYIGYYFSVTDITEDVEKLNQEHYRAVNDEFTGMYNRYGFYETVRNILNDNPDKKYYIICEDIKDFKLVNDLFGIEMGDWIIREVAKIFKENSPGYEVAGHMGGDKFAALIDAEIYNERILIDDILRVGYLMVNSAYSLHSQIGVYRIEDPSVEISIMCDRANIAIDSIKNDAQQILAYYEDDLMSETLYEKRIISEFENMHDMEEFIMYLQPQVSSSGKIIGAEALVRWLHPELGLMLPGSFISILEKANMIYMLDRHIWKLAAIKLKEWKDTENSDLYISVNISPKDFYYMDVFEEFTNLIENYGIDPNNLKIEITETALMSDIERQMNLVNRLRRYGFEVEIDDFGSGYSSLGLLQEIEVDTLKLDRSMINTTNNMMNNTILDAVIYIAKSLNMKVISEGVEQLQQVKYLRKMGCNIFQGYYFAKPMPIEDFESNYIEEGKSRQLSMDEI